MIKNLKFEIKNSPKGFTIIELIVVIAIIAVLAAIVLINVNGYIAKARDAKRKGDLTQVLKALNMYAADYGTFCVANAGSGGNGWLSYDYINGYWYGPNSVAKQLVTLKYLGNDSLDPTQGGPGYMIVCGDGKHVCLWATLEGPSTLNCNNTGYDWYNTGYGKNYCIFQ